MATSALANSLLSSSTSLSNGVLPSTNNTALLPSRVSVSNPRSQNPLLSAHFKLKNETNSSSVITFCSLGGGAAANDPKEEQIPIELKYPAYPTVMDINQIREILPHRFPFLLVDRVIEYNPGVSAVAIKNVTINDNFFPGHFPERPIMPGVLMVEAFLNIEMPKQKVDINVEEVRDLPDLLENNLTCVILRFSDELSDIFATGHGTHTSSCSGLTSENDFPDTFNSMAMAQVGGLVMLQPEVGGSRQNFFFAGIDKVRFRKPVIAGDTLVMRMTLIKLQKRFGIAKMEGKAYVGGEVVCEGEFLMAIGSE
ncbi:hypothetical protein DKX38_003803 [Salix brachista]|uniref:3-hydroxyacyl-[acyl-carrier-protein] dehydratase FabZ n=1 Tax=Salix brachista TaxID=2182728 RepID=A0A5N5N990_9ROSI|nr:hypothetical protein DKX38_003803 [Salix brachista]